ncbi:MAG: hypothetical protein KC609_20505 [Myxococcales bacterium]|nr:hypothetical protein [Myxococcales bacterium]
MRWLIVVPMMVLLCLAFGCSEDTNNGTDPVCTNVVNVTNASGLLHGSPCTQDSECMYGKCLQSPVASFKFCSKNCSCGANSSCSDDPANNGVTYACARKRSGTSVNAEQCLLRCSSVADCQKVDSRYNACDFLPDTMDISSGAAKVCFIQ